MRSDRNNASVAVQRFAIEERAGRRKGRMLSFSARHLAKLQISYKKLKTYISPHCPSTNDTTTKRGSINVLFLVRRGTGEARQK